ncbi:uncharacterized protein LOC126983569 [Eriocheir sinensis]|uniref:uncharacterized protein LOC126983569 n=1 Tax=Eriocheir sinensis TaxID=95602 RepID=UPI0021CAC052|nr:uncharacterized protein LOC126983569 [Eriocheir sinensis]
MGGGGRGAAPGLGGMAARNLQESEEVEAEEAQERRRVEERVWEHLASVCPPEPHTHAATHARRPPAHPVILPHNMSSLVLPSVDIGRRGSGGEGTGGGGGGEGGSEVEEAYLTTGGDYGRFPRGWAGLGRPPTCHTLSTAFTHHLAAAGMFRNHSLNL